MYKVSDVCSGSSCCASKASGAVEATSCIASGTAEVSAMFVLCGPARWDEQKYVTLFAHVITWRQGPLINMESSVIFESPGLGLEHNLCPIVYSNVVCIQTSLNHVKVQSYSRWWPQIPNSLASRIVSKTANGSIVTVIFPRTLKCCFLYLASHSTWRLRYSLEPGSLLTKMGYPCA
jgi:hypothetical protein